MNVLNDQVLVLNKNWQAVNVCSAEVAFCGLCRGVHTGIDTEGLRPVTFEEWMKLPIRPTDKAIGTIHGPVRVPTVIACVTYAKMPPKYPKLSNQGIKERDGARCQVTGELCPENGSVDHIHPKSRGGHKKSWRNQVWMRRDLNQKKGNRTLDEMGWKLIRPPREPAPVPVMLTIKSRADKPDWDHFLIPR